MSAYSAAILATAGLVSYWRLGEASGTSAADSKGSNTGTIAGAPTMGTTGLLTGDSNTAITFDGVNDTIGVGNAASLQLTTLTIETWLTYTLDCHILGKNNAYGMLTESGCLAMYDWTAGVVQSSGYAANDGTRHHMVFTIQSGVVGGSQFSVDGVARGSAFTYTISNNASNLNLGTIAGASYFLGVMDETAIYNTILSPATIANHYTIGATGIDPNAASTGYPAGLLLPV